MLDGRRQHVLARRPSRPAVTWQQIGSDDRSTSSLSSSASERPTGMPLPSSPHRPVGRLPSRAVDDWHRTREGATVANWLTITGRRSNRRPADEDSRQRWVLECNLVLIFGETAVDEADTEVTIRHSLVDWISCQGHYCFVEQSILGVREDCESDVSARHTSRFQDLRFIADQKLVSNVYRSLRERSLSGVHVYDRLKTSSDYTTVHSWGTTYTAANGCGNWRIDRSSYWVYGVNRSIPKHQSVRRVIIQWLFIRWLMLNTWRVIYCERNIKSFK